MAKLQSKISHLEKRIEQNKHLVRNYLQRIKEANSVSLVLSFFDPEVDSLEAHPAVKSLVELLSLSSARSNTENLQMLSVDILFMVTSIEILGSLALAIALSVTAPFIPGALGFIIAFFVFASIPCSAPLIFFNCTILFNFLEPTRGTILDDQVSQRLSAFESQLNCETNKTFQHSPIDPSNNKDNHLEPLNPPAPDLASRRTSEIGIFGTSKQNPAPTEDFSSKPSEDGTPKPY